MTETSPCNTCTPATCYPMPGKENWRMTPVDEIPALIASKKELIRELSGQIDFLKQELERYFCNALVGDKFTRGLHTVTRVQNAQQWDYTDEQKCEQWHLRDMHQRGGAVPRERSYSWKITTRKVEEPTEPS